MLRKLTIALCILISMSTSSFASQIEDNLIPRIKTIIINHAKAELDAKAAYEKIKLIANHAIDFCGTSKESRELEEIFSEIEQEVAYDYLKLNKEQMVNLIIRAINS